ncbi:MAG: hypothetical protein MJ210_04795 [Alphaproteobacteria bacterium]|nr:hypothetical protein [Alphaproteobacteria bacterium]
MKKSILLGCIASFALFCGVASAEVIKPTPDEVKASLTEFLTSTTKVGTLFDLNQMTVTPAGDGFDVVLPVTQSGPVQISNKTIHLTPAGDFNNYAQYKIESPFEAVQSVFKDILPDATLTADVADQTTLWVPFYKLISKNSQNIKGLKLVIPTMLNLSAGSLVSDALARVIGDGKMDVAGSSDGQDIQIKAEKAVIYVPSFSSESTSTNCDITSDPIQQLKSCDSSVFKYAIPEIQIKMQEAAAPMASFSLIGSGAYQNEVLHFENKVGNITSSTLSAFAPMALIPDEILLNLDFEGISSEFVSSFSQKGKNGSLTDEDMPTIKKLIDKGALKVNLFEVKNAIAGVAVSGTIRVKLNDADSITTLDDLSANSEPVIEAKVVISNLDKISPEPQVNQAQCDRATEYLNKVDMASPNAEMQKATAEMQQEMACAPQGGPLDIVRPYLDINNRVVDVDGTTKNTLVITFENDVLTVNGQQVQ